MKDLMFSQRSVMHELGNALAVMSGYMDIFAETAMSVEQQELAGKIYTAFGLIQKIIENAHHVAPISINAFLENTVSACAVFVSAKRISLNVISELGHDEFLVEEHKLSQIFINLIKNAAKHTDKGGIIVSVQRRIDLLEFCVSDTGCGIPPEYMPHIFSPFVRAHTNQQGSGLGLSICKTLVESMGGRIWAESKPGHGSKFYFAMPAVSKE